MKKRFKNNGNIMTKGKSSASFTIPLIIQIIQRGESIIIKDPKSEYTNLLHN